MTIRGESSAHMERAVYIVAWLLVERRMPHEGFPATAPALTTVALVL